MVRTMLELKELVLKDGAEPISHGFQQGRISVVLGRNHSGKTLLTRIVAGLAAPCSGELVLNGQMIRNAAPGDRSVALVYQAFVNYPNWTVFENLASPLVAARSKKSAMGKAAVRWREGRRGRAQPDSDRIRTKVTGIAEKLGLSPYLDRYPDTLSGGQQQRLAIGRALAKSASVLLLDEPLVNLDYKLREALQLELRSLLHETDMSVIYTSSDSRDAFALGDEVLLLSRHGLLQAGEPLVVYGSPYSEEAADLMSDPRANRWREDGGLAMVRPEHLYLERERTDDAAFPVEIVDTETNGSETFVHCRLDGIEEPTLWVARLAGLMRIDPGSRRVLYAPESAIMRFGDAHHG